MFPFLSSFVTNIFSGFSYHKKAKKSSLFLKKKIWGISPPNQSRDYAIMKFPLLKIGSLIVSAIRYKENSNSCEYI